MHHKRIFVSGGAGVIGTALISLLLKQGADIFAADLKPCPEEWRGRLRYRQGDLNSITAGELAEFKPELAFHLAATTSCAKEEAPFFEANFRNNIALSHTLATKLLQCYSLNKIVFASGYRLYDSDLYHFAKPKTSPTVLKEDSQIGPRNLFGAAKFFNELELQFLQKNSSPQVPFVAARIFRSYGYGSGDIISRWIRAALQGQALSVHSLENMFDFIFADDIAEGLLKLSQAEYTGAVNLGTGHSRHISDVLDIIRKHIPGIKIEKIKPQEVTPKPFEASQADIERLTSITKWAPTHTLENAIPKIISFEKEKLAKPQRPTIPSGTLITSISKKVPLIEAVRKASDKIGTNTVVHGCDIDPHCIARYAVDFFWQTPPLMQLTHEEIRDYSRHHNINAIIPTRDGDLEFFATHRSWFAQQNIHVMVSALSCVQICLDKKRFADWAIESGFPAIPAELTADPIHARHYVVKDRYGAGSISLAMRLSKQSAIEHAKTLVSPLFQPFIEGREYSVDLYRDKSGSVKGCVARRRDLVVAGESQVTTTVRKPKMEQLCTQMAEALNIYGHAVFQMIESSDGTIHIIECNPRFGGASTASIAAGLDSFYWFLLECGGEALNKYPFQRASGEIRQIRFPADRVIEVT